MRITSIVIISIAVFFALILLAGNWICSSPPHYEITRNKLQLVEILKVDTFRDKWDTTPYLEFQKTDMIIKDHIYGLLIFNEIGYCANTSGNSALAISEPGGSGSEQIIESSKLFLVNRNKTAIDISQKLFECDTIKSYRWSDDYHYTSCRPFRSSFGVSSLKDSFNLNWHKKPYITEILYIFPKELVEECPKDFFLRLEIHFLDGDTQSSQIYVRKK
jgi:hypothetical protein